MDARLAGVKRQFAEQLQISRLPGRHALSHAPILRIEMFRPTSKPRWHGNPRLLEHRLGDIAQERLIEGLQRLFRIGQHIPRRRLTLKHAEVVVRIHQATGQAREEDADLKVRHILMTLDDAIVVRVAVQEQQPVLLAQCDTRLVEQTIVQPDILALSLRCNLHDLKGLQLDVVRLRKRHDIRDQHCRTRGQTTHRQRALNDARDAAFQFKPLLQRILRPSDIVAPVSLLHLRGGIHIEIHHALKGL